MLSWPVRVRYSQTARIWLLLCAQEMLCGVLVSATGMPILSVPPLGRAARAGRTKLSPVTLPTKP
jgi:hypothetical protein